METRIWIGQSRARHPERGDLTGGSQFYHVFRPGARDGISREFLAHGVVSLHGRCLVRWEEMVYREGRKRDLPFPELIGADATSVTTELHGPSVRMLLERHDLPVPLIEEEAAALIVNVLRAAVPLAESGVMCGDGHLHNLWVWLEDGLDGGCLDFKRIAFGDHSYSLIAGMEFGRPLWCSSEMAHFPPEAKPFKRGDEEAFARKLRAVGFAGSALGDIVGDIARISDPRRQLDQRWKIERAYEEYQAPQQLQLALDTGALEPARMMQYAVGAHLLSMLQSAALPAVSRTTIERCRPVLERMADVRPECRFATLGDAADAVAACWHGVDLPDRSLKPWPPIEPKFLIWDVRGGTDPDPVSSVPGSGSNRSGGTFGLDDSAPLGSPGTADAINAAPPWGRVELQGRLRSGLGWLRARPLILAIGAVFFLSVAASIHAPQTPEEALERAQQMTLRRLVQQVGDQRQDNAESAVRALKIVLADPRSTQHDYVAAQLDRRLQQLERRYLSKPLFASEGAAAIAGASERKRLAMELRRLAELGNQKAHKWLDVLREQEWRAPVAVR
jgi:hypothetical protein